MLGLKQTHHITIITTDYAVSRAFYCDVLGFTLINETYREERDSWKSDLTLNGQYVIKPFSLPFPPCHSSRPETCGLHHLAFNVENVEKSIAYLEVRHVKCEPICIDPFIGKRSTFFNGPSGLPPELYEM